MALVNKSLPCARLYVWHFANIISLNPHCSPTAECDDRFYGSVWLGYGTWLLDQTQIKAALKVLCRQG